MHVKGDGLIRAQTEAAVVVYAKCIVLQSGETDLELIYQTINTEGSQTQTHRVFLACGKSQHSTQAHGRRTCRRITV